MWRDYRLDEPTAEEDTGLEPQLDLCRSQEPSSGQLKHVLAARPICFDANWDADRGAEPQRASACTARVANQQHLK